MCFTKYDAYQTLLPFHIPKRIDHVNMCNEVFFSYRFDSFVVTVVRDMIIPNCVWKAGRVASAVRTTAVSCLWALLQSSVLSKEKVRFHFMLMTVYTCMPCNEFNIMTFIQSNIYCLVAHYLCFKLVAGRSTRGSLNTTTLSY